MQNPPSGGPAEISSLGSHEISRNREPSQGRNADSGNTSVCAFFGPFRGGFPPTKGAPMPNSSTNFEAPSGARRLSLAMLLVSDQAAHFQGVPEGSAKPFRYLAAFQEAAPYLGLPPQAFQFVAWLHKQTMPQDWEEGSRPIAWPSAGRCAEFLGLSPSRVKTLNRILFEAGIFVLRDSPTGKRYGRRDPDKRIIEAYGFDLSPLAYRYDEFIRLAAEAKAEREQLRRLRQRATCARRAVRQIGETLAGLDALPTEWPQFAAETAELVALIRPTKRPDDLALIVQSLERRKTWAEAWLREASQAVETGPVGPADRPHNISTNLSVNPSDTVRASEESSQAARAEPTPYPSDSEPTDHEAEIYAEGIKFKPFGRIEQLHEGELVRLAPRLAAYLPHEFPDWRDIIDAAGGPLRDELGVSLSLWGEACLALGRTGAALALAIVSTKPQAHFTRGAGGYFAAMVKRAKTGELHLDRSFWKLRRDHWSGPAPTAAKPVSSWA
jgi:replication initiation protein RepC